MPLQNGGSTLRQQRVYLRLENAQHKSLYFRLLCHNGSAPALYGLPKIHKPEVPMRPLHKLSGYLHGVLRPLVGNSITHGDFIDKVRDMTLLEDGDVSVSSDVASLFTSIPTGLAVDARVSALGRDATSPERTPMEVPENFTFEHSFYRQVHGTSMGEAVYRSQWSSLSNVLSFSPVPKTFLRYDCFSVIRKGALTAFTVHLNGMDDAIKFTVEEEQHGLYRRSSFHSSTSSSSAYKRVRVQRVYRKSTHMGRYLHFTSVTPTKGL